MTEKTKNEPINVFVFTKSNGFRHKVMPIAKESLIDIASSNNWNIKSSDDSLLISESYLANFAVVVFLHTSGNILGADQKNALENFVTGGGGLVTIHSGTDTEKEWPWYVQSVGAIFTGHPPTQEARLIIEDFDHPATSFFTDSVWIVRDEWYSFDRNPRNNARVLISIDELSYDVDDRRWFDGVEQRMGDHPLVWCKDVGKGRVFQTALGHEPEMFADSLFLKHIKGAVLWAAGKQ
jgi:uncharacterized protein